MGARIKGAALVAVVIALVLSVVGGWSRYSTHDRTRTEASITTTSTTPSKPLPHAQHDPAKREELRQRLLAAFAASQAAQPVPQTKSASQDPSRGSRKTNDVEEFGRFVAQAIREDFIPMARACANELSSRRPDVRGTAIVDFELLGDPEIGSVVNSTDVDSEKSTIHDEGFETCLRESMYGVYFDPPPSGGRATLNFPLTITEDGSVDDHVEDFHPIDRR